MTITYTRQVASSKFFGVFWRTLFRWRGSVYKVMWPEMLVFTFLYAMLSFLYRHALGDVQRVTFEKVSLYCREYINSVPVTFVLGFYVSLVVSRWWDQYKSLPWPDNLAILVSNSIQGRDVRTRMMRRTIVRYANLSFTLTLKKISTHIQKKFPTMERLIEEGLLLQNEKCLLEEAEVEADGNIYWVPLVWAVSLVETARRDGYIHNDLAVKVVVNEINEFRGNCGGLLGFHTISIPLVYTQVVTIAVYSYLIATLMGRQFLAESVSSTIDLYVPIFTYLQIVFYLGWLKVAESLVNPFGKDDEDFEVEKLIYRNIRISYLIADKMLDMHPVLQEDKHWSQVFHSQSLLKIPSAASEKEKNQDKGTEEEMQLIREEMIADVPV